MQLQKAQRTKAFMRLNLSGPSGSGKTYSALLMAKGLVGEWNKIAVIDSENASANLYDHLGAYNVVDLEPPFTPERYIEAIDTCLQAGMECIIMDSSSHEWSGAGGCLEINERLAHARYKGNTWAAWMETTPRHDRFVQKVLQCKAHVITCTRSKMETVMGDDKKVKKVGMKDIQREGWEYELTVSLGIDRDTHTAQASKDRTELFEGRDPFVITEETGKEILKWCEIGVVADEPTIELEILLKEAQVKLFKCKTIDALKKLKAQLQPAVLADEGFIHMAKERFLNITENLKHPVDAKEQLHKANEAEYNAQL